MEIRFLLKMEYFPSNIFLSPRLRKFSAENLENNTMAVTRFGISLDEILLKGFDDLIRKKGYSNRSEAIRDLIRDALVMEEWEGTTGETVGTITIVYSHEKRELLDLLTRLQHLHHDLIISSMHIHLDKHNCLELIAVKGKGEDIKRIADRLIGSKGVKHGKLTLTTTGKWLK
jgi:CopG family transcriptional regulator, nickel-responsive regulator